MKKKAEEKPKKEFVKIKNRFTDKIIFESTKETLREAVLEAIEKEADLSKADLSWADLSKANLSSTNYWKTNYWKCKVTKKTKEQILESIAFENVKESDSDVAVSK